MSIGYLVQNTDDFMYSGIIAESLRKNYRETIHNLYHSNPKKFALLDFTENLKVNTSELEHKEPEKVLEYAILYNNKWMIEFVLKNMLKNTGNVEYFANVDQESLLSDNYIPFPYVFKEDLLSLLSLKSFDSSTREFWHKQNERKLNSLSDMHLWKKITPKELELALESGE